MKNTRMLFRLSALLLTLVCLISTELPALAAEDSDSFEAEYACTVYDYFSGFPYTEANVMAQTLIWVILVATWRSTLSIVVKCLRIRKCRWVPVRSCSTVYPENPVVFSKRVL